MPESALSIRPARSYDVAAIADYNLAQLEEIRASLPDLSFSLAMETGEDDAPAIGRLDEAAAAWAQEQINAIEDLEDDLAEFDELREYQTIHERRLRAAELRADIAALLELPARRTVPDRIDLSTYEEGFPPWKEDLEARLLAGVAGLVAFILKDTRDQHTDVGFVVDDENLLSGCWFPVSGQYLPISGYL